MKDKLIRLAAITSPILAVYGLLPIYLLNAIGGMYLLMGFLSLTIIIFLFWVINILLVGRGLGNWRYFWSILITFGLHIAIFSFAPNFPNGQHPFQFILYPLGGTLAIDSIILIVIHVILLQEEKEKAENEIERLKLSHLETQKQVLLQQLQPHFLFNALSTLKSLIGEQPKDAEEYVVKLSGFLRYSVKTHTEPWGLLADELQFAKDYLDLQKVRFGDALHWQVDVPDGFVSYKLPVYALQLLVENAIKHNAFTDRKPLTIHIFLQGNSLLVVNNRIPKRLAYFSGTGLRNLQERYRIMGLPPVEIVEENEQFTVKIPLLQL